LQTYAPSRSAFVYNTKIIKQLKILVPYLTDLRSVSQYKHRMPRVRYVILCMYSMRMHGGVT